MSVSLLSGSLELFHPGSGNPGGSDKHVPPETEHPGKQVRGWSGVGLQREGWGFLPRWQTKKESLKETGSSLFGGSCQGPKLLNKQPHSCLWLQSPSPGQQFGMTQKVSPFK